jgi:hypothetical protein
VMRMGKMVKSHRSQLNQALGCDWLGGARLRWERRPSWIPARGLGSFCGAAASKDFGAASRGCPKGWTPRHRKGLALIPMGWDGAQLRKRLQWNPRRPVRSRVKCVGQSSMAVPHDGLPSFD